MCKFDFEDIALVSVTFNSEKVIKNFSETAKLFKHVFIVDNDSGDQTVSLCGKYIPHAKILLPKENLGFSVANQIGLDAVISNNIGYSIFVNPDCVIDKKSIELLLCVLEDNKEIAVVSPQVIEGEYNKCRVLQWDYKKPYKNIKPVEVQIHEADEKGYIENVCINGACFMVDNYKFSICGGFSKDLFLFMEEDDIALRVARGGYRIVLNIHARAMHIGGGSTPKSMRISLRKAYSYKWSRLYLNSLYVGKIYSVLQSLKLIIISPLAIILCLLINKRSVAARWLAWGAAGWDGLFLTKFFRKFF